MLQKMRTTKAPSIPGPVAERWSPRNLGCCPGCNRKKGPEREPEEMTLLLGHMGSGRGAGHPGTEPGREIQIPSPLHRSNGHSHKSKEGTGREREGEEKRATNSICMEGTRCELPVEGQGQQQDLGSHLQPALPRELGGTSLRKRCLGSVTDASVTPGKLKIILCATINGPKGMESDCRRQGPGGKAGSRSSENFREKEGEALFGIEGTLASLLWNVCKKGQRKDRDRGRAITDAERAPKKGHRAGQTPGQRGAPRSGEQTVHYGRRGRSVCSDPGTL